MYALHPLRSTSVMYSQLFAPDLDMQLGIKAIHLAISFQLLDHLAVMSVRCGVAPAVYIMLQL